MQSDEEMQKLLVEDNSLDILGEIRYHGVPQRAKLAIKGELIR